MGWKCPSAHPPLFFYYKGEEMDRNGYLIHWQRNEAYYHGTREQFYPGDLILPGTAVGKCNYQAFSFHRNRHVYVTVSRDGAFEWAYRALGESSCKVYQVLPLGLLEVDTAASSDCYRSVFGARVVRQIQQGSE